jgi:hypothetical protein
MAFQAIMLTKQGILTHFGCLHAHRASEVCDCVVKELLKQSLSCSDFLTNDIGI